MSDKRSPEEIQEHIEKIQDRVGDDLDELSYRASPEGIKDQAEETLDNLKDAAIDVQTREVRLPAPNEYVPQHVSAMPIAAGFAALDARGQQDMIDDVIAGLGDSVVDGRVVFEDAVYLVSGRR